MWEHAQSLNAALLFIEHRYYGQSSPFNTSQEEDMRRDGRLEFLTVEQALKDYIGILAHFKEVYGAEESPVIALGGSYGGMLAAWIRMEYPDDVHGAIASSAPLLAFFDDSYKNGDSSTMLRGFAHGESYWQIVTNDASEKGGSICECSSNVHSAFEALFHLSNSSKHLQRLTELFHLCQPLQTSQDVHKLALMYLIAWDTMAMGNYPFPSNYMILEQTKDANVTLPPFPVRAACDCMSGTYPTQFNHSNDNFLDDNIINLLSALRDAGSLYYNATGTTKCNNLPSDVNFDGIWDYQYCTQLLPQETYFERDGIHDMFWPFVVSRAEIEEHCIQAFPSLNKPSSSGGGGNGVNWNWLQDMYKKAKETLTNVVFTNGAYDPWSAGGIVPPGWSESVPSFVIEEGGHHLDLMFSDVEHDPESVVRVRKMEVEFIEKWIAEEKEKKRKRKWMYQREGLLRGELSTN